MKIAVLDHKNDIVAVLVLGTDNGKIYGLSSKLIDHNTAMALRIALKDKSLGGAIQTLKEDFPGVYRSAFRTYNIDTPVVQEHELI